MRGPFLALIIVIIRFLIELASPVVVLEQCFNFLSKYSVLMWKTYLVLVQIRTSTKKCFFLWEPIECI